MFSFFMQLNDPVFLLWLIDKTEDDSLTANQERLFKTLINELKEELRR